MSQNTQVSSPVKASSSAPLVTRGLRRHQQRLARKREQVPADALVAGIDLARERQAVSFAAEAFERRGVPFLMVQPLSVRRAREESRYTPEKTDPRDADLIAQLALQGRFTDTRLSASPGRKGCALLLRLGRMKRMTGGFVRKARIRIWPPQLGHRSGSTASTRARSCAQRMRGADARDEEGSERGSGRGRCRQRLIEDEFRDGLGLGANEQRCLGQEEISLRRSPGGRGA